MFCLVPKRSERNLVFCQTKSYSDTSVETSRAHGTDTDSPPEAPVAADDHDKDSHDTFYFKSKLQE